MTRLPPAEKLSLALRKNIRDDYESKKADFEKQLSDLLGVPWTIDINPNAIWPYAKDGWAKERIGSCIASYVESAISQLKYFESYHHEEGIAEVNGICSAHVLTMDLDETKKFNYCGCLVHDGKLTIVFGEDKLGTNTNDALESASLLKALNAAPPAEGNDSKISYAARAGIRQDYDAKIEEIRKKVADLLENPSLKFSPNFDANFAKLAEEKARKKSELADDWESRFGSYTFSYFEGIEWSLRSQSFGDDDMLREGFNEAVDKSEIALRIVDKLKYESYCEVVVEDGVLYIQTLVTKWGTNASYAAQKLVDQL